MALYVITRKRSWGELRCFWSRELKPTWREDEAARFLSYAAALRHASQFRELQDFAVVEWWLGKYDQETRR
jgi:hypothetical protein